MVNSDSLKIKPGEAGSPKVVPPNHKVQILIPQSNRIYPAKKMIE
jgi:hypothetical protein